MRARAQVMGNFNQVHAQVDGDSSFVVSLD